MVNKYNEESGDSRIANKPNKNESQGLKQGYPLSTLSTWYERVS